VAGLTYDAGALIALERREQRAWAWHRRATERGEVPTVPTVVVAETWRGGYTLLRDLLSACDVEPLTDELARLAGRALGEVGSNETIDAIVVASAAQRGDVVLTQDAADVNAFKSFFPDVRVVAL
jgi:predicted nucleic acid-binding protein